MLLLLEKKRERERKEGRIVACLQRKKKERKKSQISQVNSARFSALKGGRPFWHRLRRWHFSVGRRNPGKRFDPKSSLPGKDDGSSFFRSNGRSK